MVESNKQQLRNEIIKYGVDNNYKAATIDKVLKDYGIKQKYNPLTSRYNWKHMVQTAPQNAIDFGRDALTFGGMVVKPAMDILDAPWKDKRKVFEEYKNDPSIRKTLQGAVAGGVIGKSISPLGIIPGAIIGGIVGNRGPKEFANAQLSTYNTDIDTLRSGKADWRDIVQGAQNNPVYSGLDFASIGGGKLIGGISKTVGNTIPSNSPQAIRQIFPSQSVRDLNRTLTTELGNAKAKAGKNYTAYGILEGTLGIDRAELARHIMTGKSKLKGKQLTLANGIRDSLKRNEKIGVDLGLLNPNLSKADTVAQYVMQYIPRSYNLLHADYRDIILGNKLRPTAANIIKDNNLKDTIQQLIKNGEDLYNKDSIVLLTQKLANTTDPLNEVIARERNAGKTNYFDVSREIGRTTPEELSSVLDDSIKFQLDQISFASEFEGIIDNILRDNSITKISTPEEALAIKTKALKEISKDIARGELPNLNNALSRSGIKKVMIDPLYYKSLNNLFKKPINAGTRRLLSQFKKNVLATPHWVFLNRAGNWTNNLIEGVRLKDYLDTVKYKKYIPDQLKQQTSFSAYLNEGLENASDSSSSIKRTSGSTWKIPTNKIKNALNKYKRSEKSIEDTGNLASSLYANVNDYIANPMFRAEAGLELADRYANFIRQAKRMAKKNNTNVEDILKKAQTDNKLFHKLNTEVNKSLGDYVGKNYQLPSGLYDLTSEWFPFYRFYTQTLRTTGRQLADNPLRFQGLIQAPTKIGKGERERVEKIFNLDPEWYQGGIPYGVSGNNLRTIGWEPLPIQSVLQTAGNIGKEGDLTQLLNPIASSFVPALYFQRFGRPATTPRLDEMKREGLDTSKFEPTMEEKARYFGNALLGSTSALYNVSQRLMPEFFAPFTGGIRTKYDTHPFTDIPSSYLRKLPSETMMKQLGVKTSSNYEKAKPKGKSSKRKQKRNAKFFRKKEADQNKPLIRKYK